MQPDLECSTSHLLASQTAFCIVALPVLMTSCFIQDPERQKEVEELLGPIGDDKFTYLKDVGKLITDFTQPDEEPGAPGDTLDDDIGVAVEFDADEDADEDSEVDEVEVSPLHTVDHRNGLLPQMCNQGLRCLTA